MFKKYYISFKTAKLYVFCIKTFAFILLEETYEIITFNNCVSFLDVSAYVSHMVEPDHQSEKLTCPLPIPSVPSGIQMIESPDQPDLMCPGKSCYKS